MSTETKPAEWMLRAVEEIALLPVFERGHENAIHVIKNTDKHAAIIAKHAPPSLESEAIEVLRKCEDAMTRCDFGTITLLPKVRAILDRAKSSQAPAPASPAPSGD